MPLVSFGLGGVKLHCDPRTSGCSHEEDISLPLSQMRRAVAKQGGNAFSEDK